MADGKGGDAATVADIELLAPAHVEEAFPDVQVGVANAGAGDPDQDFASLGTRGLTHPDLQRLAVLDDVVAEHV